VTILVADHVGIAVGAHHGWRPTPSGSDLAEGLWSLITTDATVAALISTRLYPLLLPQGDTAGGAGKFPAVIYQEISSNRDHSMDGPVGLVESLYQFTCWAKTRKEAREVADAIRLTLDNHKGATGDVTIQRIFIEGISDAIDLTPGNEAERLAGIILEATIWHEESQS